MKKQQTETVITIRLTGNARERKRVAATIHMFVSTVWVAFKPKNVDMTLDTNEGVSDGSESGL